MTALAVLTLNDGQATPVATPFSPTSIDSSGVAKWLDANATFDAKRIITLSVQHPKGNSAVVRIKAKVLIPTMDPVVTTKKLAESYVNIEFVMSKLALAQQRKDLRAFTINLMAHAAMIAAVDSFEGQY